MIAFSEKSNHINIQYFKTEIGELILGSFNDRLCLLDYKYRRMRQSIDNRLHKGLNAMFVNKDNDILQMTRRQIKEYLSGKRREFDLQIITVGTDFQKAVWKALMDVKYGETATYLDLAKKIHDEKSVRAVAAANGANSISLVIPCHRIIGSNGDLVGYGGGLQIKRRLLIMEKGPEESLFRELI